MLRPNTRYKRAQQGGRGSGLSALLAPASSGGSSGFTPDMTAPPAARMAALEEYESGYKQPEEKDPQQLLAEEIARLVKSPDRKQQQIGKMLLEKNKGQLPGEYAVMYGFEDEFIAAQDKSESLADKFKAGAGKGLELIGRPQQAAMELLEAGMVDLGLDAQPDIMSEEQKKKGGYLDALRALKGEERTSMGAPVRTLDFNQALGLQGANQENRAVRALLGAADFTGGAALDPLNAVGGGTKAAVDTVASVGAKVAVEAGEDAASAALKKELARQGATEFSEETVTRALRRAGTRKGLTAEQKALVKQALIDTSVERRTTQGLFEEGAEKVIPLKGDKGIRAGFRRVLGKPLRGGDERVADNLLTLADRYDRGGLRVAGRTVNPSMRSASETGLRSRVFGRTTTFGGQEAEKAVLGDVEGRMAVRAAQAEKAAAAEERIRNRMSAVIDKKLTKPQAALEDALEKATLEADRLRSSVPDGALTPETISPELREQLTKASYLLDEVAANPQGVEGLDFVPLSNALQGQYADEFRRLVATEDYAGLADLVRNFEPVPLSKMTTSSIIPQAKIKGVTGEVKQALTDAQRAEEAARREALRAVRNASKAQIKAEKAVAAGVSVDKKTRDLLVGEAERARAYADKAQAASDEVVALREALEAGDARRALEVDPGLGNVATPVVENNRRGLGRLYDRKSAGTTRRAFKTGQKIRESTSLPLGTVEKFKDIVVGGRAFTGEETRRVLRTVEDAAKKAADEVNPEDWDDMLRALDAGGDVEALSAAYRAEGRNAAADMLDVLNTERARIYDMIKSTDMQRAERLRGQDDYMARYFTDEGREALRKAEGKNLPALQPIFKGRGTLEAGNQGGHALARSLNPDWSIQQINDYYGKILQDAGLLDPSKTLLETNPAEIIVRRSLDATRGAEAVRIVDQMADEVKGVLGDSQVIRIKPSLLSTEGKTAEQIAKDTATAQRMASDAQRRGMQKISLGEAGDVFAHPDLADDVFAFYDLMVNDETIRAFGQFLDTWNKVWKSYATVPLIGASFHTKNSVGNMINNYLRGVGIESYTEATALQLAMRKAKKAYPDLSIPEALAKQGESPARVSQVEAMLEQGVLDESFFRTDLAIDRLDSVTRAGPQKRLLRDKLRINPARPDELIGVRSGRKVGEAIEDNARIAHWLHVFNETGDITGAANSVKKYLFDYGDLTPFERRVMKRVSAFYTFARKNTPLQLSEMVRNPSAINRAIMAEEGLLGQGGTNSDNSDGPSYLGEMGAPAGKGLAGLLTGNDNPAIVNIETPTEAALKTISPLITLGQMAGNKDELRGAPIRQELWQSILGNVSGGPAEFVKIGVEDAGNASLFTGAPIYDEFNQPKDDPYIRLLNAFVPAAGKASRITGFRDESTENLRIRFFKAMTGAQAKEVTGEIQDQGTRSRTREIELLIKELQSRGEKVPTVDQLRKIGVIPPAPEN